MANRRFEQYRGALEKGLVTLYGRVSVAGSGAVTLQAWNVNSKAYATAATGGTKGIKSVVRTGTGAWTVTLQDSYIRLMSVQFTSTAASGVLTVVGVGVDSSGDVTSNTAATVKLLFNSATATAADPASGDKIDLRFELQNSGAL